MASSILGLKQAKMERIATSCMEEFHELQKMW